MLFGKNTTLFFAPYSCREGLTVNDILKEQVDISASIINYNKDFKVMTEKEDNGNLHFKDEILDANGNLLPLNKLTDARRKDLQTIIIQENSMYIIGVITTATLIIAAILISK